jgi:hypothetical protein
MKRFAWFHFALGMVAGAALAVAFGSTVAAQWVDAPNPAGVQMSQFDDGTTCYTNINGGIYCIR